MTSRESERARGTHKLPMHRRRNKLGHQDKARGPGGLTLCRAQMEIRVRMPRQSERAMGTHELSSADGRTRRDAKTR
jgi:hypothetical protein